jgi:hypothetical protein
MNDTTYQGWANYETWNVALYIQNEKGLYRLAKSFQNHRNPYNDFRYAMWEMCGATKTPDDVSYADETLDYDELDQMIADL